MSLQLWPDPLLAIETSCDDTCVAVLSGQQVLANVVASQLDLHQKYGGVVPEVASRAHLELLIPTLSEALTIAGIQKSEVSAVAVTNRPGLVGALSVGVTAAKTIAVSQQIPLIGVHHLEGHLLSAFFADPHLVFPYLALLVSGGHTELVLVDEVGRYRVIGETRDDAAGEAFDKGARLMGLGYPGGKAVQEHAATGIPGRYELPIGLKGSDTYDFSFSGLKTAVLRLVESEGEGLDIPSACLALQSAIVDALLMRTIAAADELSIRTVCLCGGVAANTALRERLKHECTRRGIAVAIPDFAFCTDNAAMIGLAGSNRLALGERSDLAMDASDSGPLPGS